MDVRWIALTAGVCSVLLLMGSLLKRSRRDRLAGAANSLFALAAVPAAGVVLAFAVGRMVVYWLALALTAVLFLLWFFLRVCRSC